jgi:hypothetical protein
MNILIINNINGDEWCSIPYNNINMNIDSLIIDYLQKNNLIEKLDEYKNYNYKFVFNNKFINSIKNCLDPKCYIINNKIINIICIKEEYIKIYSTKKAYTALINKNIIISWGDINYGGNNNMIKDKLNNIKYIY